MQNDPMQGPVHASKVIHAAIYIPVQSISNKTEPEININNNCKPANLKYLTTRHATS